MTTLDREGPAAPPRRNGELVFEAPWESRVFGLTLSLCEAGVFEWEDFRANLIREIGDQDEESFHYYACWQAALERLLIHSSLVDADALAALTQQLASRPHGHDH